MHQNHAFSEWIYRVRSKAYSRLADIRNFEALVWAAVTANRMPNSLIDLASAGTVKAALSAAKLITARLDGGRHAGGRRARLPRWSAQSICRSPSASYGRDENFKNAQMAN
jgi:hypothetical protein